MKNEVCPWWMGYFLLFPTRKFMHSPKKILSPYIQPGMQIVDYGSAMGYFSLPMAKMTGNNGKVYCFDIQPKMLTNLAARAENANVKHIISPRLISGKNAFDELTGLIDFALLFAVAHEVSDKKELFVNLSNMLKPGARVLFAEPRGHVSFYDFSQSVSYAEQADFKTVKSVKISKSYAILLEK
jgi:2-polyprenyl-3-methyl-5-hydroxy-6-metoxy-1,4-benzoquinol methylase